MYCSVDKNQTAGGDSTTQNKNAVKEAMASNTPSNRKEPTLKRKYISLEEKIKILDRLNAGENSGAIAKSFRLNESTVRTIGRNEKKTRDAFCAGSSRSANRVARVRNILLEKTEKALILWIEECCDQEMPLGGNAIKAEALRIYAHLKQHDRAEVAQEFSASKGWFENFKRRFDLTITPRGDAAPATLRYPKRFFKSSKGSGYAVERVHLNGREASQCAYISRSEGPEVAEDLKIEPALNAAKVKDNSDEAADGFTINRLREGLNLAKMVEDFFTETDPSTERAGRFKRKLQASLAPYFKLHKELLKANRETIATDFLVAELVEKARAPQNRIFIKNDYYVDDISSDGSSIQ